MGRFCFRGYSSSSLFVVFFLLRENTLLTVFQAFLARPGFFSLLTLFAGTEAPALAFSTVASGFDFLNLPGNFFTASTAEEAALLAALPTEDFPIFSAARLAAFFALLPNLAALRLSLSNVLNWLSIFGILSPFTSFLSSSSTFLTRAWPTVPSRQNFFIALFTL